MRHIAPTLGLFISNDLQAYRRFIFSSAVLAKSVIGLTFLPVALRFDPAYFAASNFTASMRTPR
jgi:hypothetical protein